MGISQEQKELLKCNKKHFSKFQKSSLLDKSVILQMSGNSSKVVKTPNYMYIFNTSHHNECQYHHH